VSARDIAQRRHRATIQRLASVFAINCINAFADKVVILSVISVSPVSLTADQDSIIGKTCGSFYLSHTIDRTRLCPLVLSVV